MCEVNIIISLDEAGIIRSYRLADANEFKHLESESLVSVKTEETEKATTTCPKCFESLGFALYTTKFVDAIKEELKEEPIECFVDVLDRANSCSSPDVKSEDDFRIEETRKKRVKQKRKPRASESRKKNAEMKDESDGKHNEDGDGNKKEKKKKRILKYNQPSICEQCGKYFPSLKNMYLHLATHKETKDYACHHCSKTFKTKRHVRQHLLKNHITGIIPGDPKFRFACTTCNPPKRFPSTTALKAHMQSHNPDKQFPCPHCNRWLKCENNVKYHIYKFHTNPEEQKKFRCDKCPYVTVVKSLFQNHQWSHVPNDDKPFKCVHCGKGFANRFSVQKHEKTHLGIKQFVCQVCGNRFGARSELKDHLRLHTGEKPYECHVCFTRFGDRKRYRQHMLAHESELGVVLDKSLRKFDKSYMLKNPNSHIITPQNRM